MASHRRDSRPSRSFSDLPRTTQTRFHVPEMSPHQHNTKWYNLELPPLENPTWTDTILDILSHAPRPTMPSFSQVLKFTYRQSAMTINTTILPLSAICCIPAIANNGFVKKIKGAWDWLGSYAETICDPEAMFERWEREDQVEAATAALRGGRPQYYDEEDEEEELMGDAEARGRGGAFNNMGRDNAFRFGGGGRYSDRYSSRPGDDRRGGGYSDRYDRGDMGRSSRDAPPAAYEPAPRGEGRVGAMGSRGGDKTKSGGEVDEAQLSRNQKRRNKKKSSGSNLHKNKGNGVSGTNLSQDIELTELEERKLADSSDNVFNKN